MIMELQDIFIAIKVACDKAKATAERMYALSENEKGVAYEVINLMDAVLHCELAEMVMRESKKGCRTAMSLDGLEDGVQYSVGGLAKVLGVSTETVRRWCNDPRHPLKAHYRKAGSHRKFFLGKEVRRAFNARIA